MIRKFTFMGRLMDHQSTRAIYEHWESLRAGRDAPFRSEIDPRRISAALENMFILEQLDPDDVRFRLAGTGLVALLGIEPRGMIADAVMDEASAGQILQMARQVTAEPAIAVMRVKGVSAFGAARPAPFEPRGEMILLPMRSELGGRDRILGAINMLEPPAPDSPPLRMRLMGAKLLPIEFDPARCGRRAPAPPQDRRDKDAGRFLAEAPAPFARRQPAAVLTAIEGNPEAPRDERRPRPALRVVKD
ncbi:PAS domain-containing protein [Oceanicella actignis]|nr:PAS domain-containing protein [Oceanicella actignis]